jgi:ethanolamine utilization protein EutN
MLLAVVQGHATATVKHATLAGQRLLIAQQLGGDLQPTGDPQLIIDQLGAGRGDVVIISSDGRGLRERLGKDNSPARWFTLGIIDSIERLRQRRAS